MASNQTFAENLMVAGFVPLLAIVSGLRFLIALASICLNFAVVWVTIRSPRLQGTCNFLIALESLSLAFYQFGICVIFGVVISGRNLIPLGTCFWVQAMPVFGKYFSLLGMMVAIGLDRVKCILLPRWPSKNSKKFYLLWLILLCSFCPFYILYLSFMVILAMPETFVMCASSDISQKEAGSLGNYFSLSLNSLSPIVYSFLIAILCYKGEKIAINDKTRRIYKSLIVIVFVELFGWGTNSLANFLLNIFLGIGSQFITDYTRWSINCIFSYIICMATAANAPTLYFFSSEYRDAFRKQFRLKLFHASTQSHPQHRYQVNGVRHINVQHLHPQLVSRTQ